MTSKLLVAALALVALLPLAHGRQDDAARLAEARRLLGAFTEKEIHEGADAAVALNSPAAVEALLGVLERTDSPRGALPPAHFRDVAWGALQRVTDPYARKRVEQALRESESARVRQWCAELLGLYGDADAGANLAKALDDREDCVVRAAARALGQVKYAPAAKALESLAKKRDPYLRANAIEALARIEPTEHAKLFAKGLADKDGGVRCALLGAAAEIYPTEVEGWSIAARAKDEDWRPRMQAVEDLGRIRTKTAVDALLSALDDGRPVVGLRALRSLQELTGQSFTRKDPWVRWWTEHRESFAFPEGAQAAAGAGEERTVAMYNGIRLVSDHVAFLIDKSQKMQETLKERAKTKDAAAYEELEGVLTKLEGRLVFDVHCYEEAIDSFEDEPVALSKKTARNALAFVRERRTNGSKDVWQALEAVLANPDIDTAYLLTSGEPDTGLYVHWNRVVFQLQDANRFHKLVVHGIAYSDNDGYAGQIQRIAESTGGEFRRFR